MRLRLPRAGVRMLLVLLVLGVAATGAGDVSAAEVGTPAPGFTLPSTTGGEISLHDFRGRKMVLLEFFGAAFAPV